MEAFLLARMKDDLSYSLAEDLTSPKCVLGTTLSLTAFKKGPIHVCAIMIQFATSIHR